jgi:hypothetical protein
MTGVERLIDGAGEHAFDGLTDEAQDLALYISGRDANEGKHEAWGMDEATWARWIAAGQEIAAETERVLVGPWLDAWLDGEV